MMRLSIFLLSTFISSFALAQSAPKTGFDRVQLNDIEINGEANSDGMRFSQRQAHDINERLKLRTDFIDRVEEIAPTTWSKPAPAKSLSTAATSPVH